ncbi:MAG: hypothetical protein K2K69_00270, partial [Muribaculaceae bacterium]|nr:hypothetical protein [Muribaculaceae bacterium]
MTLRHILYPIAAAILTGLAVTSCVYDEAAEPDTPAPVTPEQPADSEPETATITLSLTAAPMGTSSRAEGDQFTDGEKAEDAAQANELINNWFVAFIRDGKIYATADGVPGAVWNDRVSLELPRGTYSAIAFANIPEADIPQEFKA